MMMEDTGKQSIYLQESPFDLSRVYQNEATGQIGEDGYSPVEGDYPGESGWGKTDDIQHMGRQSTEAFWQMDKDLKFTYTNAVCEKISGGIKSEEFVGKSLLDFLTPEGIEHLWRVNGSRLKNEAQGVKTDLMFYELQMMRKDGSYFWAGISSCPLRDAHGQVIGYQGIMRDISVLKAYEAERKRLEYLLRKAEKMAAVGQLTGGIAHELNNLIAGILGHSELLLLQDPLDSDAVVKHVESIVDSSERGAAILRDLLVMTRRNGESRKRVDLNDLIRECLRKKESEKRFERFPDIALYQDLEPSLSRIQGVLPQLDKILMNLIALSCEKAGPGGVVSISTRTVYLGRPIKGYENLREGEYVVIAITDNGGGIEDEHIGHVFEPFYVRKVMKKGFSGLELSVAREVIHDHNGFINVLSKPGYGATFTVYLPVAYGDAQALERMMPETVYSMGTSTIN